MLIESTLCLAAQELATIQSRYAANGLSISKVALCGSDQFKEWKHYPKNDLIDEQSDYEFYYHAHSSDEMPHGEHGHFHLFKRDERDASVFHHLIAISLDQTGLPMRIFTTNQWVTGERWLPATQTLKFLKDFDMAVKGRMAPLSRWVSAFTKLFYLDMEDLIIERDRKMMDLSSELGGLEKVYENRDHHVLTEKRIDLLNRLSEHLSIVH